MWLMATSAGSAIGWWFRLCTTTANTEFVCTDNFRATSAVSLMSPLSRVPLIASWSWTTLALVALIFFSKPAGLEVLEVGDCVKLTRPNVFREFSSTKRLVHDQSEEQKPKTITELSFFFPSSSPLTTPYMYINVDVLMPLSLRFFFFLSWTAHFSFFISSFVALSWTIVKKRSKALLCYRTNICMTARKSHLSTLRSLLSTQLWCVFDFPHAAALTPSQGTDENQFRKRNSVSSPQTKLVVPFGSAMKSCFSSDTSSSFLSLRFGCVSLLSLCFFSLFLSPQHCSK